MQKQTPEEKQENHGINIQIKTGFCADDSKGCNTGNDNRKI
jgi:hypothetical protein